MSEGGTEGELRSARAVPVLLPVLLGTALLVLFAASFPARGYGDDVLFVQCIVHGQPFAPHFLFLPLARLLARSLAALGLDPFHVLRLLSAAGAAAGGAFLHAAARRRGAGIGASLVLVLLVLGAPSALFFATAPEVHGLHLGALGLLAWSLARLEPRSSPAALFLVGLGLGLAVGTHSSGVLLLPGAAAAYALATPGRGRRARALDLAALAVAGALTLACKLAFNRATTGGALAQDVSPTAFLGVIGRKLAAGYGWREFVGYLSGDWVAPAFLLAVACAAALGALAARRRALALSALAALAPYGVVFPLFGYPEHGAYYVVTLPVLAALLLTAFLGRGEPRARWSALAWVPWLVACAGAPLRPDELQALLGALAPAALAGLALVAGAAFGLPRLPRRRALAALAIGGALQGVGAARTLVAYDAEEDPDLA